MRYLVLAALAGLAASSPSPLAAQDLRGSGFRIEETGRVATLGLVALKPRVISFADQRKDPLADPGNGLLRFEDWAKSRPLQRQYLSPWPGYAEPTIQVTVNGITKPYLEKLHIYEAEARFEIARSPAEVDLSRIATLQAIEKLDPSIRHRAIQPGEIAPLTKADSAHARNPTRPWCEGEQTVCLESRYDLEGKLPLGIQLANKLEEGAKKIDAFVRFQSELRVLPASTLDQTGLAKLTGLEAPVIGAIEHTIFDVNQMMQFGKLMAVFQPHPTDPKKTVVTAFMALGVESDVLEKKKEFEKVPILRNLVPAQVLVGNSSFNTGRSISAGLPEYTRQRIRAIAEQLERS